MKIINKAMSTALSDSTSYTDELQAAVNAHNAAAHTITGVPPEEVMMGRKIVRRLPLIHRGKVDHNQTDLDAKDKRAKLAAKVREDIRRGARECRVKPGDTVILERPSRAKGETRFDPRKYTVVEENDGNLVVSNDQGQTGRRHVSQTKKVQVWREETEQLNDSELDALPSSPRRSTREKRPPGHLDAFVRSTTQS